MSSDSSNIDPTVNDNLPQIDDPPNVLLQEEAKISAHGHDFSQSVDSISAESEVIEIKTRCFECFLEGTVKMCVSNIPNFKETLIIAFNCDYCGAKSNEIKAGGGISEKGKKLTLKVKSPKDLKRFVIKSDTSSVEIPEIGLELTSGTLGAQISTLEGILEVIFEELSKNIGFVLGQDSDSAERRKFNEFTSDLASMKNGTYSEFTFIMDDPLDNSSISICDDGGPLLTEIYERTDEQNEELGISNMHLQYE